MSKNSEAVKLYRKRYKQRMIDAMGGKCQCCGYNKCQQALEFHHIDSAEKEKSISEYWYRNAKWADVIIELRKCVLLCSNCHKELHAGFTELPNDYKSFNEDWVDYRKHYAYNPKEKELESKCKTCNKVITDTRLRQYCSNKCRGASKQNYDWSSVDWQLHIDNKETYRSLGKLYGVSDNTVKKHMLRAGYSL